MCAWAPNNPENVVSVDHPEVQDFPQHAGKEWGEWRFFRNRSRWQHLAAFCGGIFISFVTYIGIIYISDSWNEAIVHREASTRSLRFQALLIAALVCQLYFVGATVRAYGHWFLNFLIFPIAATSVTPVITHYLFTETALTPVSPLRGDASISNPTFIIDIVKIGTPLVILAFIAQKILRTWIIRNPSKAKQWERKYMHVALISYLIEKEEKN